MPGIDGINPLSTSRTQQGLGAPEVGQGSDSRDGKSVSAGSRGGDAALVSSRGRVVAEAARAVAQTPDIRSEKVAALKAAIQDGTYNIDPEAIARRLFSAGIADE